VKKTKTCFHFFPSAAYLHGLWDVKIVQMSEKTKNLFSFFPSAAYLHGLWDVKIVQAERESNFI